MSDEKEIDLVSSLKGTLQYLEEEGHEEIDLPFEEEVMMQAEQLEKEDAPVAKKKQNVVPEDVINPRKKKESLLALRELVVNCTKCSELAKKRTQIVFGAGNARARLCIVGEAPGRDEDLQGKPFVGRSGQLLTKMIEGIGLSREEVFIHNVLKCRPPENRNPLPEEIELCEPFLLAQLKIIQPKVICCLGTFAAQTLLKTDKPIGQLRGQFHDYHGIKLIPTFHPAYLLRNPKGGKEQAWEDLKMVRRELDKLKK